MGFRYYDWECRQCGAIIEGLTWVRHGGEPERVDYQFCKTCDARLLCDRRISVPAPYMGEKQWFPTVAGGSFDTLGQKPVRQLPDVTPEQASDGVAMRDHFRSAEWKDAKAERREQIAANKQRQKRHALAKQGVGFNLRRSEDRLPGDPKI